MEKSKETQLLEGLNDNVGKYPVDEEDNDEGEQLSKLEQSHASLLKQRTIRRRSRLLTSSIVLLSCPSPWLSSAA